MSLRFPALVIQNRWVLITGASSGLGASLAREIAIKHGANLLLASRRLHLMENLATSIQAERSVQIVPIEADLSHADGVGEVVKRIVRYKPVAAVLNAGITRYGPVSTDMVEADRAIVATNIMGFTELLHHLVAHFCSADERRAILAVSSLGGETTLPDQAVYGASKAYVTNLTLAVRAQLKNPNLSIGVFIPGGIATDMGALSGIDARSLAYRWGMSRPEDCAHLAVRALTSGRAVTIPGTLNRAAYLLARHMPRTWTAAAADQLP